MPAGRRRRGHGSAAGHRLRARGEPGDLSRFPHAERVRGKLLQLARAHGRAGVGGVVIDLPLTHDLIADSIGSTRETVTLALQELSRTGFVEREGRRYRVRVPPEEL